MSKLNFGDKVEIIVKVNGETVSISAEELFQFFNKPSFYLSVDVPYDFKGVCFLIQEQATCYYERGRKLHRADGPAVEYKNGTKKWYLNGKIHREGGPAIERSDRKEWHLNGKLHRVDAPAVEYANGDKSWYINDKLHREDGPAIEHADGDKFWYLNDLRHRVDGPAVESANGDKWWFNGRLYCKEFTNETWMEFIKTIQ